VGEILRGVEGIGIVHFGNDDVVRHKMVQRIVQAYGEYAERSAPGIRPASSQRRA
jgi:phosphate starvation-inducible PhoH-like protein